MPRTRRAERGNVWIGACAALFYPATRLLGRRRFVGREYLPAAGPVLVVANHISHLDPLYDTVFIHSAGRWPRVMAKASLWHLPVLGTIMARTRQIPVERSGGAGGTALEAAKAVLAEGGAVLIYPEGTVTKDPEHWPMRPRPGVAVLALATGAPVIPMAHWGSHQVYTSYGRGLRLRPLPRKDVHVVAGPPIDLSRWDGQAGDARAIRDVSLLIMTTLQDMVAELRGQPAPAGLFDPKK